ncbi:MAG TPA: hypothetical protein VF493_18895 [Terriglobales bacterium]
MRSDLRAYVVYALAVNGVADSTMLNSAYKDRGDMSVQGLAMLALALHLNNDQRTADIAGLIENKAVVDAREAHWDSNYDYFMEFETNDGAETTAYTVRALSLVRPQSPLLTKAAFWLVNHRDGGFFWLSTKQTAMVVFGLTEYLKTSHEFDADFSAQVYVNNKPVLTKHFTRADTLSSEVPKIHLKTEDLQAGNNVIKITKSGAGKLYWSARGEYYSAEKRVFQNNRFSLNITRDYYRLAPEKIQDKYSGAEKIVYHLDPLSGEMQSGDVIAVRVTVGGGSNWRYLLIEDPIPAGAEFVQRDDLYEIKDRPDWWGFWYTRREFHDDHAAFFQSYFSGKQQYLYLLKIINPGKFKVSPASVQPMYEPAIISTTDAAYLEVH